MQHAMDDIKGRIDALYGKFSSRDLLKDLELEHNEEVVNDRVQTPSCDVAEALAMTKVNTEVASFKYSASR
jgi:hypothetical protein